jgi:molybdate transport system regulatory protein
MTVIKLRIDFDGDRYIGHGRIQLLELIGQHGSIAQAAKAMGMSYKRAWYLMDEFSAMFTDPLIERQHGGRGGGAAKLTPFGADVIRHYRDMEAKALVAFAKPLGAIEKHLLPVEKTNSKSAKNALKAATAKAR